MKKILALLILAIWLTACAPSVQAIQTAIAQTQAAPAPKLPSSLLDLQRHLPDFLPQRSDLPTNVQYHRFAHSLNSIPNQNVNSIYVKETGRMDGWEIYYIKDTKNASAPQEIHGKVVLYLTNTGAQRSITKYSDDLVTDFAYLEEVQPPAIGDETRAFLLKYQKKSGGSALQSSYWIEFSYRNIVEVIRADGAEDQVQPDLVNNIARLVLARLQASPRLNP